MSANQTTRPARTRALIRPLDPSRGPSALPAKRDNGSDHVIHETRRLRAPLHRPSKSAYVETVQTWSSQLHRAAAERAASRALTQISVACWRPYGCRRLSVSLGRMLGGRHTIQLRNRRCLTGVSPSSRRTATLVWPHPLNGDVLLCKKCPESVLCRRWVTLSSPTRRRERSSTSWVSEGTYTQGQADCADATKGAAATPALVSSSRVSVLGVATQCIAMGKA